MNFESFATEANNSLEHKFQQNDSLPDYYNDPYLRRYWLIRYIAEAGICTLGVWGFKLVTQNLVARKFKMVSPWLQLAIGSCYLDIKLHQKFQIPIIQSQGIEKAFNAEYHHGHFLNSQYWH